MKCRFKWIEDIDSFNQIATGLIDLLGKTVNDDGILGFDTPLYGPLADSYLSSILSDISRGGIHLLVGTMDDQVVVTCTMQPSTLPTMSHTAELKKGVIDPDYRGYGLLDQAFGQIAERAMLLGVEQLVLDVREGTPAHEIWRYSGFKTFGILEDYARFRGHSYRGHYMYQSVAELGRRFLNRTTSGDTDHVSGIQ